MLELEALVNSSTPDIIAVVDFNVEALAQNTRDDIHSSIFTLQGYTLYTDIDIHHLIRCQIVTLCCGSWPWTPSHLKAK